jgi:hypothetical protein
MGYDVFISYSHGGDDLLSERVQEALSRFAKPWYRRRALNVFRDRTALAANPGLWTSIAESIEDSRYLLFLASPDAAQSVWCSREVEHFRAKHGSEGLLVLLTDGEILWDEEKNDFDWSVTTALGPAFAGAFREEPFHVDMRWARSEEQLDLTDGRFRNQVADLAAPVHGMAKDELASEDVRQHRRAIRQAIAAGVALVFLTVASVVMSVFAVNSAAEARRNAARARTEQHKADVQRGIAVTKTALAIKNGKLALKRQKQALANAREASRQRGIALDKATKLAVANTNLNTANVNLTKGGRALRKSTLLAEARLAARRAQLLTTSGDQTYQLGVLMAAEAVRHGCASSAIDPNSITSTDPYPNPGCLQPGIQIDGSVASSALVALSSAGGRFVTGRLAGSTSPNLESWSSDGRRFVTYSAAQSNRPDSVQVWNVDGTLAATASSAAGLTSESALSGDGNVLAVTTRATGGTGAVSAWSLSSRGPLSGVGRPGRRPAMSANGASMAWLAPGHAKAVEISVGAASPRVVALADVPASVAVNADGSLAAVLVNRGGDNYSLVPVDLATGKAGVARDVGNFATPKSSVWSNPPMVSAGETVDPPALWFAPGGSMVWAYNNERHVGVEVRSGPAGPRAQKTAERRVPVSLGGGALSGLEASTPDARTIVLFNLSGGVPTYQAWKLSDGGTWTTLGVAPLLMCGTDPCSLSISPNGAAFTVSSLSALQIVDLRTPASTSSGVVPNAGGVRRGAAVVAGPTGKTALSWSAHVAVLIDTVAHTERSLSLPLDAGASIEAVGFDPSGAHYVAIIARGAGCPCRAVVLDAQTGAVTRVVDLGRTDFDRIAHEAPVSVALNDSADLVAVTFDNNPAVAAGPHRCALVTYSLDRGQPLQVIENRAVGLGERTESKPAFEPGADLVAVVATDASTAAPRGVLVDARSGGIVHAFSMRAGVVTAPDSGDFANDGYALRFSPNGGLLAWNAGGSVVIWDVGSAGGNRDVVSDVVLTSSSFLDPTALAISDNGEVATAGLNFYGDYANDQTEVVLTGDELGRLLQPLGIGRIFPPPPGQPDAKIPEGQISVALPVTGETVSVALDFNASRFFVDTFATSPGVLLDQLCTASARQLTQSEWQTYFPGETYAPACSPSQASAASWDIDASLAVAAPALTQKPRASKVAAPSPSRPAAAVGARLAVAVAAPAPQPNAAGLARRSRYIRRTPKSLAAGRCPT